MTYAMPILEKVPIQLSSIDETIPVLATNIAFHIFDTNHYLVQQNDYGFNVKVNKLTYAVLQRIDGQKNLIQIADELNQEWNLNITASDINTLLFKGKLSSCGIVITDTPIQLQDKASYLRLRFTLIPAKTLQKITHWFAPLFEPQFFFFSAILMLVFMGVLFLKYESLSLLYKAIEPQNIMIFYGVVLLSAFIHELGHSAACRRFGAKHGDIGFGFYLFTPVLYADVSDAWKLSKSQRIIIDMAGVYMEIILCMLCCAFFLYSGRLGLLHIALLKLLGTQGNLNPFIRADAYWAVSDWFNIPNLKGKADQKLIATWAWVSSKATQPLHHFKDYFLLCYALISWVFMVTFLTSVLVYNSHSVLYFPYNFYIFVQTLFTEFRQLDFDWFKAQMLTLLLPFMFYFMLYNLSKQKIKKGIQYIRQFLSVYKLSKNS